MTEETPVVLCECCRTPIKEPLAQIRGEYYCNKRDCRLAAKRELEK